MWIEYAKSIVLVVLGGVGGAIVSFCGNIINNKINHKKELVRLTYQRKLAVSENAMGVLGSIKDKLTELRIRLQNSHNLNQEEFQRCSDELVNTVKSTELELYKLYLYYDIDEIEQRLKLQELMQVFIEAIPQISELTTSLQDSNLEDISLEDIAEIKNGLLVAYERMLGHMDRFFDEIINEMRKEINSKM